MNTTDLIMRQPALGGVSPAGNWNPGKLLLTFDEASDLLSVSQGMLRKLVRSGSLQTVHIGRSVRITKDEVLRLATFGGVQ
jgi:excisionase family DNA binding protein